MFRRHVAVTVAEERKDLFGPVADLMVGVVFIFIILLVGLSLHLQPEDYQRLQDRNAQLEQDNAKLKAFARYIRETQLNNLFERLAAADQTRAELLVAIKQRLDKLNVQVTIDPANGTLKLPAGGLFLPGQADPTPAGRETIGKLGEVLVAILPCYLHGQQLPEAANCQQLSAYSSLSSVYLEGHTDIVPISTASGRFHDNWDLSAARAIAAFKLLREQFPTLRALHNPEGDALLGVSGYAETRPATAAPDRKLEAIRDLDRRIEVRLVMTANQAAVRQAMQELSQRLEAIDEILH